MKRALIDRLIDVKGLLPPYHIAQVQLSHAIDEFEHSRSTVEAACQGKRKIVPSSAGDAYFWPLCTCLNISKCFAINYGWYIIKCDYLILQ